MNNYTTKKAIKICKEIKVDLEIRFNFQVFFFTFELAL